MSIERVPHTTPAAFLRDIASQAAIHPRVESAVIGALRSVLPGVIEEIVREMYPGGERVRFYTPKVGSRSAKAERDRRICALVAPPSKLPLAQIARQEGLSLRRVQQIVARNIGP
jgi:hypothetical protein